MNLFKKIGLSLVLFAAAFCAQAATETVNGIEWNYVVKNGEAEIYNPDGGNYEWEWSAIPTSTTGTITIPSSLGGYPVTSIGNYAFYMCWHLESVTIPNSVTRIGECAFCQCSSLRNITIPSSVTDIGSGAFHYCDRLKSVTIPNSVTNIGRDAFSGCNPTSVTVPGWKCNIDFSGVKNLVISEGTTSIGKSAFMGCRGLTSVTIPDHVINIGYGAFGYCDNLRTAYLPSAIRGIVAANDVFEGCSKDLRIIYRDSPLAVFVVVADGCEAMGKVSGGKTTKAGTKLTLKATANKGYVFSYWEGTLDGATDSRSPSITYVVGDENVQFTAYFVPVADDAAAISFEMADEYVTGAAIASVAVDVSGCTSLPKVTVKGLPSGLKFTAKDVFKKGSKTEIEYPANTIYGTPTKSGVYTVVATVTTAGKKTATATAVMVVRKEGEQIVKLNVPNWYDEDNGTEVVPGKVTGAGIYAEGKKVSLKATANKGFVFAGWWNRDADGWFYGGDVDYRNPSFSFEMWDEDVVIDAIFVPVAEDKELDLTVRVWIPNVCCCMSYYEITENANDNIIRANGGSSFDFDIDSHSLPKVTVSGLPKGVKFDSNSNAITGIATVPGLYVVTVKLVNATVKKAIERKFTIEVPNLMAANAYFYDYLRNDEGEKCSIPAGVANAGDLLPSLEVKAGVKLSVSGLPAGLRYDAKTGKITGIATKAGNYTVTLTVTDGKEKYVSTMTIEVEALPDWAAGTFAGLVGRYEGNQEDDDFRAQGTLSMSVAATGKISAKVALRDKTYSFSSPSYVSVEDGAYLVQLETKAGDVLELAISEQEVLSVRGEGAFLRAADDEEFYAFAWRNEHGAKNRLESNPKAAGAIGAIAKEGTVYLSYNEGGFKIAESSKKYDLKLSVNAKSGVVTYSGNVDGIRVSGSEFLKFDCVEDNYYYIIADLVVYDKKTDTVLYFAFGWDVEVDENGEYAVSEDFSLNSSNIKMEDETDLDMVQLWENGPYWATKNIGAEKPEDYGYYFWWGDTVGYKPSGGTLNDYYYDDVTWVSSKGERMTNSPFDWDTCPTMYKDNEELLAEGYIDSTGNLAPAHDAANVHWGNGWRIPTDAEFDALSSNCDWTRTTLNGVNGYVVKGRGAYASKSIFLPAAGYGYFTSLGHSGSSGYYWSSVPNSGRSDRAWNLYFYSSSHLTNFFSRFTGQSVRPVLGFTK